MDKNKIYQKLSPSLQNIACTAEGMRLEKVRYGRDFQNFKKQYAASGLLYGEELFAYQNERLKRIITHCYRTVPYYQKLFADIGITDQDIRTVGDLQELPILTKEIVKANPEQFLSNAIPEKERYIHNTSGTSGAGLAFQTTHQEDSEQWAVWWRYRNNLGIQRSQWCGLLNGKVIIPVDYKKTPYWRVNLPGKQFFFSSYHLNEETVLIYADEFERRKITWLHGYPIVIAEFARLLLIKKRFLKMDFITTGSENLTESHKYVMQKAFGVEPYQHYGLTEGVANFSQDSNHVLRIDEDFAYVEFVGAGEEKSIVGTTFSNYAMPLIRYDTGDCGALAEKQDGGFRIVKDVYGRSNEFIRKKDGSMVTSAAISLIFNSFSEITQAQLIQKLDGTVIVNMILHDNFSDERKKTLFEKLYERLGRETNISLNVVNQLEKTQNGKTKLVIVE